ncbi:MAG: ATP-dependent zinc metalloprotease FtsH [Bacteroidales bacterium]|nr:ATP-dependent zinc metalloprotease FtsH [Bacteroidales bacterium]
MYIIYLLILLGIVGFWMQGTASSPSKNITWQRLETILMNGDEDKIVVVNQEFAEVYIKRLALKNDSSYRDLYGKNTFGQSLPVDNFYRYEFVTFESFEKDIERVENRIITRDTVGVSDAATREQIISDARIDLKPEKRRNTFHEIWVLFGPLLIMILLMVFFFRMMSRQMGGAAGGAGGLFSVGKSKAKVYDGKTSTNVTFKDVAGLAGAKEEVMEVVDFLKNPGRYTELGGKIPKGVLLVGPPGTGKTLLAKAVAGEANVPFFSMSGSDFVEMFVGVGASRVRDLFEEAKKKSPCIIFIDEIDAVGRARGRSGLSNANDERENTLNQLLTEMDGFGTNNGVIVMAATNRADVLDKALLRAGRFDRQIYVELPDLEERKAIFEVHMKNLRLGTDIDKDFLAKQTPGFSGADIANVCNEAALVAARKEKKIIERQDFLDAIDRIIGGLEKRTKVLTDGEKRKIAYHESGHASVSWLIRWGDPLVKVTIVPRGKALGAAWYLPEERQITTKEQMFDSITSLMAGRAAEQEVFGEISTGALNDMERATKMAFSMVAYYGMSDKVGNLSFYDSTGQSDFNFTKPFSETTGETIDTEVRRIVEGAYDRARTIISEHREQLDRLAQTLYDREVIFKDDVEEIYGKRPWDTETTTSSAKDTTSEGAIIERQQEAVPDVCENEAARSSEENAMDEVQQGESAVK